MTKDFDYTIAAIPTVYEGRQYRSRLEARWAAFFDLLGLQHEYEPYDLGAWSPDFLVTGRNGLSILVEVKPLEELSSDVAYKMMRACRERAIGGAIKGVLLTRTAATYVPALSGLHLGWTWLTGLPEEDDDLGAWGEGVLCWYPDAVHPRFNVDITHRWAIFYDCLLSRFCGDEPERRLWHYPDHSARLWAEATNRAQWSPS